MSNDKETETKDEMIMKVMGNSITKRNIEEKQFCEKKFVYKNHGERCGKNAVYFDQLEKKWL